MTVGGPLARTGTDAPAICRLFEREKSGRHLHTTPHLAACLWRVAVVGVGRSRRRPAAAALCQPTQRRSPLSSATTKAKRVVRTPLPRRVSPAAINRYRQCPKSVWFQYVAKVERRERPSPVLCVGNAVHAALDKFFGLRPEDRSLEVLHRCLRAVWRHHTKPGTFVTREEERDYGRQALGLLTSFHETFDTSAVPLARERWVSTRLPNGIELFGKVDRVDGEVRSDCKGALSLIDYKTGRFVLDSDDVRHEAAAQAYLLAAEDEYGREVERFRFLYLASGDEARWDPEREDVDWAGERLLQVTNEMYLDQEFEARPGEHCGRCPYAQVCPDAGRVELAELHAPEDLAF